MRGFHLDNNLATNFTNSSRFIMPMTPKHPGKTRLFKYRPHFYLGKVINAMNTLVDWLNLDGKYLFGALLRLLAICQAILRQKIEQTVYRSPFKSWFIPNSKTITISKYHHWHSYIVMVIYLLLKILCFNKAKSLEKLFLVSKAKYIWGKNTTKTEGLIISKYGQKLQYIM